MLEMFLGRLWYVLMIYPVRFVNFPQVCKKWSAASKDGKIWEKLDLSRVRGKKAAVLGLSMIIGSR